MLNDVSSKIFHHHLLINYLRGIIRLKLYKMQRGNSKKRQQGSLTDMEEKYFREIFNLVGDVDQGQSDKRIDEKGLY